MVNGLEFTCISKYDMFRYETTIFPRPEVLHRLDYGLQGKLTLICAPAGYGKTLLVDNWLLKRNLRVVRHSFSKNREDAVRLLNSPSPAIPNDKDSIVIVFDDCQEIQSRDIYESLHGFIKETPESVHIVMITREEPPFSLSALRLDGELTEIRCHDLKLSINESADWFEKLSGLSISIDEIRKLEEKTEGWPVAVCLATRDLRQQQEISRRLDSLSDDSGIDEFFREQVFLRLPSSIQDFLMKTSLLDWLVPGLCEKVAEGEFRQRALSEVQRRQLFVSEANCPQTCLHYHPLFSEFLRSEARRRLGNKIHDLHQKASGWFYEQGYWREAIIHALKAQDYEKAVRLIDRYSPELFKRGEWRVLQQWLEDFSELAGRLPIVEAWINAFAGKYENALRLLNPADSHDKKESAIVEGYISLCRLDARKAFARFQEGTDSRHGAGRYFQKGIDLNQGEVQLLRSCIGMGGRLSNVSWLYTKRMRQLWKHKEPGILGYGSDIMAELLYERNQRGDLMYFIIRGIELGKRHNNIGVLVSVHFVYIKLKLLEGKLGEAWTIYENIRVIVEKSYAPDRWLSILRALKIRMLLQKEPANAEEVNNWMETCGLDESDIPDFSQEFEIMTFVRGLMFNKQYSRTRRILSKWNDGSETAGRIGSQIEIFILQSLVFQKTGNVKKAYSQIRKALVLAEPEGYVRSFLDEGYPLAELLASVLQKDNAIAKSPEIISYIEKLLALFEEEIGVRHWSKSNQKLVEPLTQRELDILRYIGEGLTNPVIAGRLGIKTGTVKGYIVNLLGKLDVSTRVQAVRKAKELGLVKQ